MLKRFRVKIKGEWWYIHLLRTRTFNEKFSKKMWAVTVYDHSKRKPSREIFFKPRCTDRNTVMHEVIHAYFSYIETSRKSYGEMEEIFCEFLPKYLNRIVNTSRKVMAGLKAKRARKGS